MKKTVPTYIASTFEDNLVPSLNSIMYAKKLAELKIPYELHIFKNGIHGLSTFDEYINQANYSDKIARGKSWVKECGDFFKDFTKEIF